MDQCIATEYGEFNVAPGININGKLVTGEATAAYLAQLPPEAHAKATAYTQGGHWLLLWGTVVSVLVATYLGVALRCAAIGLVSGWVGQYAAIFW